MHTQRDGAPVQDFASFLDEVSHEQELWDAEDDAQLRRLGTPARVLLTFPMLVPLAVLLWVAGRFDLWLNPAWFAVTAAWWLGCVWFARRLWAPAAQPAPEPALAGS